VIIRAKPPIEEAMPTSQIYDAVVETDPKRLLRLADLMDLAASENHPKAANYQGLFAQLKDYMCFHVLEMDDEPVAFAGLWNPGVFPKTCARALTRTFYHPKIRNARPISGHQERRHNVVNFAIRDLLPRQVAHAQKLGLEAVFISIENGLRRGAARSVCQWIQRLYPEQHWRLLGELHNTCRNRPKAFPNGVNPSSKCWQNIVLLELEAGYKFPLPAMSAEDWRSIYAKSECSR